MLDLIKDEGLHVFLQIIQAAELEETLNHMKDYTMFAPTDLAIYGIHVQINQYIFILFDMNIGVFFFFLNC